MRKPKEEKKQLRVMIQSIKTERRNLLNEQRRYKIELQRIKKSEQPEG